MNRFAIFLTLLALLGSVACDTIDNKSLPLLMMGAEEPLAYDLACPVESSHDIILSIDNENLEAVCPKCGSHYNPLTGAGGPVRGVAINNKVGMRQYRVLPNNGGYIIVN